MNILKRLFGKREQPVQAPPEPVAYVWAQKPIAEAAEALRLEVSQANRRFFGADELAVEISPAQDYLPDAEPGQQCLVLANFRALGGVLRPLNFSGYAVFLSEEKGEFAAMAK